MTPPQTRKSKRSGTLGPIPATYESASDADKTLLRMKDVEGSSWANINSVVCEITGVQVGGSTLAVQYARIKANMQLFEKSDVYPCQYLADWWMVDDADGRMHILYIYIYIYIDRSQFFFSPRRILRTGLTWRNGTRSRRRLSPRVEISTLRLLFRRNSRRWLAEAMEVVFRPRNEAQPSWEEHMMKPKT